MASVNGGDHSIQFERRTSGPIEDPSSSLVAGRADLSLNHSLEAAALEAAANAVVIASADGVILWVNTAFTKLCGFSRHEAIGQSMRILKSGRHPPEFYRDMWTTIRKGEVWRGEIINRHKDGHSYTEEMTITPVPDANGDITNFVAVKQDVTERKNRDRLLCNRTAELEKSNEDLQHFAYIVSHDLREPLRMVSSYLDF
ncbi:MAG: PAS domain S-box protein [Verrucomicrobia bacterium]|nr:PAS domain S-box protein [Verrucomicrobiota bacterium]MDA1086176.1 PAS domain S-box protein [Verrucomicrobiota bacterium]